MPEPTPPTPTPPPNVPAIGPEITSLAIELVARVDTALAPAKYRDTTGPELSVAPDGSGLAVIEGDAVVLRAAADLRELSRTIPAKGKPLRVALGNTHIAYAWGTEGSYGGVGSTGIEISAVGEPASATVESSRVPATLTTFDGGLWIDGVRYSVKGEKQHTAITDTTDLVDAVAGSAGRWIAHVVRKPLYHEPMPGGEGHATFIPQPEYIVLDAEQQQTTAVLTARVIAIDGARNELLTTGHESLDVYDTGGKQLRTMSVGNINGASAAFSGILAVHEPSTASIDFYETNTGNKLGTVPCTAAHVSLVFTPNGRSLLIATEGGLALYDIKPSV